MLTKHVNNNKLFSVHHVEGLLPEDDQDPDHLVGEDTVAPALVHLAEICTVKL